MALTRLVIDGYGQLELNQVAFRRDGNVEAQCRLDATKFLKRREVASSKILCENGMLLAVDRVNRNITLPGVSEDYPIAINYTTEHMYDERQNALKDYCTYVGEFYPRLGFLKVGELFTSNCLAYDNSESGLADDEAVKTACAACATTAVYGKPCANGAIQLTKVKPTAGVILKVVKCYTMPDGQFGLKFQVINA